MFRIILTSVVSLMHAYVIWRAWSVPHELVAKKVVLGVGVGFWLLFVVGLRFARARFGLLSEILEIVAFHWMAILFLAFVCMVAADLLTGFGHFFTKHVTRVREYALAAAGLLSLIAFVQGIRAPSVTSYDLSLTGLPDDLDGTVMVAISDLHLGTVLGNGWLKARIDQVEAQNPDIVVLLGDIFEGHGEAIAEFLPELRELDAPMGVWAVLGNHEFYGRLDASTSVIETAGYHLLRDATAEARHGLIIAGVDDLSNWHRSGKQENTVSTLLSGRPSEATILLSHSPLEVEQAADNGVDLMLSAHTHAGQIWPFGYLVKHFYPYFVGRYQVQDMTLIVCRGTGTWGPRMRLWKRGEIVRISLRSR